MLASCVAWAAWPMAFGNASATRLVLVEVAESAACFAVLSWKYL